MAPRLGPDCARAETRQRLMPYLRGLLRPAERTHSWPMAEVTGATTPDGFQSWLGRADGAAAAVRAERRVYLRPQLGEPHAGLVIDATGVLNQGRPSAGVARPYRGTAGQGENGQMGVCVADARRLGDALLARERDRPAAGTTARARGRSAGIPDDRDVATTPPLAQQRRARAFAAGMPAAWVSGARVDGQARQRRRWLAGRPPASVLAVSGQEDVRLGGRQRPGKPLWAALPPQGWTRLSAGDGTTGPRWDDWRGLCLVAPPEPGGRRWRLVRRRLSGPTKLTASMVFAPQDTTLAATVPVAGTRWPLESGVDATTGAVGLDDYAVRRWPGW
jgi:SRSO17 transposase